MIDQTDAALEESLFKWTLTPDTLSTVIGREWNRLNNALATLYQAIKETELWDAAQEEVRTDARESESCPKS